MKPITIDSDELNLLNQCSIAIDSLLSLPNHGRNYPSFDSLEIFYDTSMECTIQIISRKVNLVLYWETDTDEGYDEYKIHPDAYGDFVNSIQHHLSIHNTKYKD